MDPLGIPRYMGLQGEPGRAGLPRPLESLEVAAPDIPGLPGIDLPVTRKNPEQWQHPELPDFLSFWPTWTTQKYGLPIRHGSAGLKGVS